jgi:DNA (cytosine-5)-methyltransferase 1
MIKFIDLFAGIGGIRLGFEKAARELGLDTECVFTSEIDGAAKRIYQANFPDSVVSGDIRVIDTEDIPCFDYMLAGFPCQAFSVAGNKNGFADTRGTLFFEILRILAAKKPYGFILENVDYLLRHDDGNTFKVILHSLNSLGYNITYKVLNSSDFSVPQHRKRVFIVGTLDKYICLEYSKQRTVPLKEVLEKGLEVLDNEFSQLLFSKYDVWELAGKEIKDRASTANNIHSWDIELFGKISEYQKQILEKIRTESESKKYSKLKKVSLTTGIPLTVEDISMFCSFSNLEEMLEDLVAKGYLRHTTKPCVGYRLRSISFSIPIYRILDPDTPTITLVAAKTRCLGVIDGGGIRKLSHKEILRLFGFPDDFRYYTTPANSTFCRLFGNTVVVPVVEQVARRLLSGTSATSPL